MEAENLIPIDELEGDFDHFLQKVEGNKRIFFTGRFGIGKTYFLKEFFISHKNDYEVFHLFPVRYQINRNEDIIDLLKYDILVELLNKNKDVFEGKKIKGLTDRLALFISFFREEGSINGFLQWVVKSGNKLAELSPDPLMQFLGKLGRPLQDLLNIDKEFQKFKKEYQSEDKKAVKKFVDEIKEKNISETDYLSHLLYTKILQQKGNKCSVLILDDMDRIDPDHIFRILNVFSAHFDGENNKFGFDHIIIVGDIKNFESVFHHRYGEKTDFWGYFDKFFTVKPYYIDNKKIIAERIPYLVKQIKYEEDNLKNAIGESGYIKLLLSEILNRALAIDMLNLRQLYKPITYTFVELKKGVFSQDSFGDGLPKIVDIGIKLLIAIFGSDKDVFVSILQKINTSISDIENNRHAPYEAYIGSMMKSLIDVQADVKTQWRNYYFTAPTNLHAKGFTVEGKDAVQAKFFYEVLIEYVEKLKYRKSGH